MLINPNYALAAAEAAEIENTARALGYKLSVLKASSTGGIEAAFATLTQQRPDALIVRADSFFNSQRGSWGTADAACALQSLRVFTPKEDQVAEVHRALLRSNSATALWPALENLHV